MLAESLTEHRAELGAAGDRSAAAPARDALAPTPGSKCSLPTPWAVFTMHGFADPHDGKEHFALALGDLADGEPVLARVHSECLTGDAFQSLRCDCGPQLQTALRRIAEAGRGVLLYLRQEGRGIGLVNKIRAYALQDGGADTVDANLQLGLAVDLRRYECCKAMLDKLGVKRLRLMTNNPDKVRALSDIGVEVVERLPIRIAGNRYNRYYLATKSRRMAHWL